MMRHEPAQGVLLAPAHVVAIHRERARRNTFILRCLLSFFFCACSLSFTCASAQAQTFRFNLRAAPDIIPANGISTSTILVQVQNTANSGIGAAPIVRFVTSRGTIERQARLTGGVARVLLRSTTTPGTAVVTAFIGGSSEQVAVEFSGDKVGGARYLEVIGPYVAYGSERGVVTAAGRCVLEYGDTHIESDVRLDVDLYSERIWAQGNSGNVLIRHGRGANARELRGDRLYYDLRRRRGVMRRSNTTLGAARQEFMDSDFKPLPQGFVAEPATTASPSPVKSNSHKNLPEAAPEAPADKPDKEDVENKEGAEKPAESTPPTDAPLTDAPASITPSTVMPPAAQPAQDEDDATRQDVNLTLPGENRTGLSLQAPEVPALSLTGDENAPSELRTAALLPEPGTPSEGTTPAEGTTSAESTAPDKAGAPDAAGEKSPAPIPEYQPLPSTNSSPVRLVEPLPPRVENTVGYWIAAKRMRVFPQDKIQFQQARVFFNGRKLFSMPLYVVPVDGAPNPISDIISLNSGAGLSLKVPYYYMASPRGTGSISLIHTPGSGFAAGNPGFSVALHQQYWMSKNSYGQMSVDQIGRGGWNANWQHSLQLSPTMSSDFYLDMPEHKNVFFRNSIYKDFRSVQLGFEGLYSRPDGGEDDAQGQFFARLRPRSIGRSGWVYYVAGSIVARRRYIDYRNSGSGGGIGLPGHGGRPGDPRVYPILGQTLNATLQAPTYRIWKGAALQGSFFATAFNYSNDRRGVAPGVNLSLTQKLGRVASFQLDYSYDKGGGSLYGDNFSHYLSGTFSLNIGENLSANAYLTKSLADNATYGFAGIDYFFAKKWRVGLIADYSRFSGTDPFLNFGWSIGRMIGQRELSLNWDRARGNVYFQFGNLIY